MDKPHYEPKDIPTIEVEDFRSKQRRYAQRGDLENQIVGLINTVRNLEKRVRDLEKRLKELQENKEVT